MSEKRAHEGAQETSGSVAPDDSTEDDDESPAVEPATSAAHPRPLNFLEAARTAFAPKGGPRPRAQPASGTEADAAAVNYIDRRERIIALVLAVVEVIAGVTRYVVDRKGVEHASKALKISVRQAHLDTLSAHHFAPDILILNLALALFVGAATLTKRRALVGFAILIAGFGMNATAGIIGLVYLGVGLWMVFRSMKRRGPGAASGRRSAAASARAGATATASGRGTHVSTSSTSTRTVAKAPKPTPSKRYTPPTPRRRVPSPPPEPEKESRLTSWLRR